MGIETCTYATRFYLRSLSTFDPNPWLKLTFFFFESFCSFVRRFVYLFVLFFFLSLLLNTWIILIVGTEIRSIIMSYLVYEIFYYSKDELIARKERITKADLSFRKCARINGTNKYDFMLNSMRREVLARSLARSLVLMLPFRREHVGT